MHLLNLAPEALGGAREIMDTCVPFGFSQTKLFAHLQLEPPSLIFQQLLHLAINCMFPLIFLHHLTRHRNRHFVRKINDNAWMRFGCHFHINCKASLPSFIVIYAGRQWYFLVVDCSPKTLVLLMLIYFVRMTYTAMDFINFIAIITFDHGWVIWATTHLSSIAFGLLACHLRTIKGPAVATVSTFLISYRSLKCESECLTLSSQPRN